MAFVKNIIDAVLMVGFYIGTPDKSPFLRFICMYLPEAIGKFIFLQQQRGRERNFISVIEYPAIFVDP